MEEENMGRAYQILLFSMKTITLSFVFTSSQELDRDPLLEQGHMGNVKKKIAITASHGLC